MDYIDQVHDVFFYTASTPSLQNLRVCVFVPLKAGITITFASFVSEREHSQVPVAAEVYPRDVNKDKPFTVNERFQQPLKIIEAQVFKS